MKHEEEWQIIVRRIREAETAESEHTTALNAAALELAEASDEYESSTYYNFAAADRRYREALIAFRNLRHV